MKIRFTLMMIASMACISQAATVQQIQVHSDAMNKDVPVSVIFPESYKSGETRYPVIYMLHGAGGNHTTFLSPITLGMVDQYNVIAICPDGARTSWWLDSPIDPTMKYETFVAKELVAYVDKNLRTLAQREKRGITGGSMGGHGACYVAFKNKAVFGAIGNIYGGVDMRPFPENWDIKLRLGTQKDNPKNWEDFSVVTLAKEVKDGDFAILTMVGNKDFFLGVNRAFNQILQNNNVQHYYIEAKGAHTHEFAAEAIPVMFRFITTYFTEGKGHL